MAFWLIVKKAISIWLALRRLKRAKLNAYRQHRGLPPVKTCGQIIWHIMKSIFKCFFLNIFCWFCVIRWKNWRYSLWDSFWVSGTFPNELMKSFVGLACGVICTHVATWFLIYSVNISPALALTLTFTIGSLFSLGLAFTQSLRCFTMLAVPPLIFSKQGRVALLAYILVLALSGPGKNTAHNMEVLTESLVCSEEMANNATGGLIELAKSPRSFFRKAFAAIIDQIKATSDHVIRNLRALIKIIVKVVEVIMKALKTLKSVADYCKEEATAYKQCLQSFNTAIDDCRDTLPSALTGLCDIVKVAKELCPIAKLDQIILCWLPEQIIEGIKKMIEPIIKVFKDFLQSVKIFFKVGINVTYEFNHKLTPTKSFKEIVHEIKEEVHNEFRWLLDYIDWMDLLVSCFFLYGFVKALIYRHRFLNSDRYDNWYITKGMVKLDWERKLREREYIFPLKYRETQIYVDNYSLRLLAHEKKVLKYSLAIVTISSCKILSYVFLDLLLFLFLELLRKYGAIRIETEDQLGFSAKILGDGFLADMYRRILHAMTPVGENLPSFDTTPCLPIAKEPDYLRYALILFLLLIVFLGTLAEPYGMRSRHIVCEFYYPERKIPRDRWLYFHILGSRGNFFTFAKNQILAKVTNYKATYKVSLVERLSHTIPGFHIFAKWMGWEKKSCVICGKKGDKDDFENFVHCPSCHTVFCKECYEELENQCPLCSTTIDFDDIDEETGSEDSDSGKDKVRERKIQRTNDTRGSVEYKRLETETESTELSSSSDTEVSDSDSDQLLPLSETTNHLRDSDMIKLSSAASTSSSDSDTELTEVTSDVRYRDQNHVTVTNQNVETIAEVESEAETESSLSDTSVSECTESPRVSISDSVVKHLPSSSSSSSSTSKEGSSSIRITEKHVGSDLMEFTSSSSMPSDTDQFPLQSSSVAPSKPQSLVELSSYLSSELEIDPEVSSQTQPSPFKTEHSTSEGDMLDFPSSSLSSCDTDECHHHQGVEPEVIEKYDDVLSELESSVSVYNEESSEDGSSGPGQSSSTVAVGHSNSKVMYRGSGDSPPAAIKPVTAIAKQQRDPNQYNFNELEFDTETEGLPSSSSSSSSSDTDECHHHQRVEPNVIEKYEEVLSELETSFCSSSRSGDTASDVEDSDSDKDSENDESESETS